MIVDGKRSRRSISIAGATYDALRKHCDGTGESMSQIVEEMLAELLGTTPPRALGRHRKGEPLTLRPPKEIDDRPRAVSCFSAIPTQHDRDKPRKLNIPEGRDGGGRPSPAAAEIARRRGGAVLL